ncbi:MAG: CpaD family pilus assembly lipoprotein [Alphaproteobacteria bacterium]
MAGPIEMKNSEKGTRSRGLIAAAAGALALLAGCGGVQNPAPGQAVNRNQVREVQMRHDVLFAGRVAQLDPRARTRIDSFLARSRAAYGDRVSVSAGTIGAAGAAKKLARQRRAMVARYLRQRSLRVVMREGQAGQLGGKAVTIKLARYVVVPPNCPDWDAALQGRALDGKPSRFGCMNASSLGAMVANPGDLVEGRTSGAGDAEYLILGLDQYRAGKAKTPKIQATK